MNRFSERLKELRLEKGLTQMKLAEATGLSQAGIAKWENGNRLPSLDCLLSLANYFECSLDFLVGRYEYS